MTVIASWGGTSSNAYIDHASANSFVTTSIYNYDAWTAATTVQREAALIMAAVDIDAREYVGGRYYYDQRLKFPRMLRLSFPWNRTAVSSTVFSVEYQRMQLDVERASCYQALQIIRNSGRNQDQERQMNGITAMSEQIGPISKSVTYGKSGSVDSRFAPEAFNLLAPWRDGRKAYRG